jgi:signal transduction histidine kinase
VLQAGARTIRARDRWPAWRTTGRMTRLTQSLLTWPARRRLRTRSRAGRRRDGRGGEALEAVETPEGVGFVNEVEPDLVAEGDPVLLRQVMTGLLSNACAYTPAPGTVTLRASRGAQNSVTIEVQDTGKGIPPDEQDRVFDRFYRGSGMLEGEGFGLGLSIAKRMVNVMGGRIGLRSESGKGSTFWVRLRAAKPTPTPEA